MMLTAILIVVVVVVVVADGAHLNETRCLEKGHVHHLSFKDTDSPS